MKTRVVDMNRISLNNLTRYGRKRNEAIWKMMDKGCEIIKEYRESCNTRVYIGYKSAYHTMADCVTRVHRNGTVEQKETNAMCSPFPGGMKTYHVEKIKEDKNGYIHLLNRLIKIKNGKVIFKDELKVKTNGGIEAARRELYAPEP